MTNQDLQRLIDDPRFLKYHAEVVKPRRFNPFDVLRYADYEIRHSNVLAWLLQPDETHGIGDAFLKAFATALNEAAKRQHILAVPVPSSFRTDSIRVERELHYVDITLFFETERVLIAIENKTEETAPEHAEQVQGYERKLRETYGDKYEIRSVLLTTSREEASSKTPRPSPPARRSSFIHMSWSRIHDLVTSLRERGRFQFDEGESVRVFLGHYLEVVERLTAHSEAEAGHFGTILDDYGHCLNELMEERADAGSAAAVSLPDDLGKYRKTVERLVRDLRQKPRQLRSDVQTFLRAEGFRVWTNTPPSQLWYFLYFDNASMEETRQSLLGVRWYPRWVITFGHREVLVQLQIDPPKKEAGPAVDRITEFMKKHPIDTPPERRGRYPRDNQSPGCFMVYKHQLMTDDDLSATPMAEIKDATLRKVKGFLDEDFSRIETYLQCMAFDPAVPT